jgi:hypothetical protein
MTEPVDDAYLFGDVAKRLSIVRRDSCHLRRLAVAAIA